MRLESSLTATRVDCRQAPFQLRHFDSDFQIEQHALRNLFLKCNRAGGNDFQICHLAG